MTESDRREFLKKTAAAAALGVTGAGASATAASTETRSARVRTQPGETLRSIGAAVLPTAALGSEGVDRIVAAFEDWLDGFEPVAELPHGYLVRGLAEIRYGPPHPGPRWSAQVEALELEAERRHRAAFAELTVDDRRRLIERQLERDELERLPSPAGARHVAVGLMAFFYASSEATDLCYQASIGRFTCRGLGTLGREPRPLAGEGAPRPATGPASLPLTADSAPEARSTRRPDR